MVGLSLDYDVFLVSRIVEYRAEGKSDVDSVLLGLAKTGRIIAAAMNSCENECGGLALRRIALTTSGTASTVSVSNTSPASKESTPQ